MTDFLRPASDVESTPFWLAAREHRLVAQRCSDCGKLRFPVRPICPHCHSWQAEWTELSGRGHVRSWVITHHVTHPAFVAQLPYTIVYVELTDQPGLVMYGNLRPPRALVQVGLPVRAVFDDVTADVTLVQWKPDEIG
jgi:uncharacterized OB-fold protein